MKIKKLLLLIILLSGGNTFSQECENVNMNINSEYSYVNDKEGIKMPLNQNWNVVFEYKKAIVVFLKNDTETATCGILKNINGYLVKSAHNLNQKVVYQLLNQVAPNVNEIVLSDVYIRNIPAKEVKYNYSIRNIDESYNMSGLMYLIVNGNNTFVFMLSCIREDKACYTKFFKSVLKNTYFNPSWYKK